MDIDRELFNYATPLERRALEAIIEHGECQKADKALGRGRSYTSGCYNRVKARAAKYGYAPGTSNITARVPEGFAVKRLSARFDKEGNPAGGWLISEPEAEARIKALREVAEALAEDMPRAEPITPPELVLADLLNLYTFTDYHLGMLAWHREGGADWDLGIAERMLNGAMRAMVGRSPPAYAALLNIQGDFLHTDGNLPVTPAHQNVLDADSRYPKIRRAAIRSIRSLIDCALKAHSHVHIIVAEGNHDEAGSGWLADLIAVLYENEKRVSVVNDDDLPFYVFEWGAMMLGVHHGHKVKNEQLPLLFAAQYPEQWGRTKRREIHCGHRHHRDEKEYNGVTVVQHPTLAARDAFAARGGWVSDRAAWAMTYHKRFGLLGRAMVPPEMIEEA